MAEPGLGTTPAATGRPVSRDIGRLLDVATVMVVLTGRLTFSLDRTIFSVTADEPATLAMARWFAGEGRWNMFGFATWNPGSAVVLAPLHWAVDDRLVLFRSFLVVNALVAAGSAVVLRRIAERFSDLPPVQVAFATWLIVLAPAAIASSAFIWAEPLVSLCFLASLLALMQLHESGRLSAGCAAIAIAAAGWFCHARLVVVFVVVSAIAVGWSAVHRGREPALKVALLAVALGAMCVIGPAIVVAQVWDDPAEINTVNSVAERLLHPVAIGRSMIGQVWYQLVAWAGLGLIGLRLIARTALSASADSRRRTDARLVLALVVPLFVLSAVFMVDRPRADHQVYGRYNDAVLWLPALLGVLWAVQVVQATKRRRVASWSAVIAVIAAAGLAVEVVAGDRLETGQILRPMIPALVALSARAGDIDAVDISLVACLGAGAIAIATISGRRWIVLATLAGLITLADIRLHTNLSTEKNSYSNGEVVVAIDDIVPPDEPIGYSFEPTSTLITFTGQAERAHVYQWYLPDREFLWDRGPFDDVGPWVIAPVDDRDLAETGARMVWRDPNVALALWSERTITDTDP